MCSQPLKKFRPTIFYGVPTLYAALLADPAGPKRQELNLRVCVSAGEALPAEIGKRWTEAYGCDILDGIGSTEMLHIFLSNRPGEVRYGTTGKAVPGYELRIVGDDGQECGAGEIGELADQRPERRPHVLEQPCQDQGDVLPANGRAAATSTRATPTATTPMAGAATTC